MRRIFILLAWVAGAADMISGPTPIVGAEKLRVLIIDGENQYHDWQTTTPLLQRILRESGRFEAEVATLPAGDEGGQDASGVVPPFGEYDAVLGNHNGQTLPSEEFRTAFANYVRGGGAFVCVHAASNSWAEWPEYNAICGLGGWYGRDENWGPYVYFKDDKLVRDDAPGGGGHHGPQHEYTVRTREVEHPIMQGLPAAWLHAKDELYDTLRGPAENLTVLATAYSDPEFEGTGRDEPMLMTIEYGDGRVFHTAMGHADYSMQCVGFITTLLRGAEWAATGEVTIPVPEDFPTAEQTSSRE
jgi:uncharacterized protein